MFFRIVFSYILGFVKVSVEGYYVERLINICKNKKILIWNLKRKNDIRIEFNIGINDVKKIFRIVKKLKCKIKILDRKGMPFFYSRYKKRKIFLIFLFLIVFFVVVSSNFIWNVEINEENNKIIDNIYNDLNEAGLKLGVLKNRLDTKEIINEIRIKRNDIAWIGIQIKGTNAIVKIVKKEEMPEIVDENEYCNIVSNKSGIITKINAQNGTSAVKVGDTVNVGTPLINGWLEGKYTGIRYVHARGEIEAKVWYTKSKKIKYDTIEKNRTGKQENRYKIKINNFEINLTKTLSKFKNYDTIDTENKIKLFSNLYIPISFVKTTYYEIEENEKNYNFEEAKEIAIEELYNELDEEILNKDKIVNKIVNINEIEDEIEVSVTYEVLENIGTKEKIVF